MELKEIWEQQGKELIKENFPISLRQWGMTDQEILDCMEESFIRGCEFEHNRSHWFDPEKGLPTISENGRSSEPVLCKITGGHIKVYRYDHGKNVWRSLGDKVISWAYIPK